MSNKAVKELSDIKDKRVAVVENNEIVKHVETLLLEAHTEEQEVMEKIGLNQYSGYQKKLTEELNRTKQMEKIYQRPVFMGKDIMTLCQTYYLKMLPAKYFIGEVAADVPRKINEFCKERDIVAGEHEFFIMAPAELFNTTKQELPPKPPRQRDPILFYRQWDKGSRMANEAQENEEFVQVCNWGKDFTNVRKFKHLFSHYVKESSDISMFSSTVISAALLLIGIIFGLYSVYSVFAIFAAVSFIIMLRNSIGIKNIDKAWNEPKH